MVDLRQLAKTATPAILGLGFIGIVWMNHRLFQASVITARGAIGIEMLYLLVFVGAILWQVISALYYIRARPLIWLVLVAASIILGLYFVTVGIDNGAAVLYAT
jgi:hypothetical protein